jgi:hypothetical protein
VPVFAIQLGFVAVGLGVLAYFTWKPKQGEAAGPYARGTMGGGLIIVGIGVALILGGLISLIIN